MDTVLRAEPRDVIALVWFRLGYRPRDSLVLVGLHGPARLSGVIVRVDLPAPDAPPALVEQYGARLGAALRRSGASAAIGLMFADDVLRPPPVDLVRGLRDVLADRCVDLVEVLGVDASTFRSLLCDADGCCPSPGRPLDGVMDSPVAAAHVLAGDTIAPDEEALVADVEPVQVAVELSGHEPPVDPAGRAVTATPIRGGPVPGTVPPRGPLDEAARRRWWGVWTRAFEAGSLPVPEAAGFAAALGDRLLRDAVLVAAFGAEPDAIGRALAGAEEDGFGDLLGEGGAGDLGALLAVRPGREAEGRIDRARAVLAAAARAAPPGQRAAPLAVLAWLAWYLGRGARTRLLLERALADAPGHQLALMIASVLDAQVPPPWAKIAGALP